MGFFIWGVAMFQRLFEGNVLVVREGIAGIVIAKAMMMDKSPRGWLRDDDLG